MVTFLGRIRGRRWVLLVFLAVSLIANRKLAFLMSYVSAVDGMSLGSPQELLPPMDQGSPSVMAFDKALRVRDLSTALGVQGPFLGPASGIPTPSSGILSCCPISFLSGASPGPSFPKDPSILRI